MNNPLRNTYISQVADHVNNLYLIRNLLKIIFQYGEYKKKYKEK
jgi:hypothetical protein